MNFNDNASKYYAYMRELAGKYEPTAHEGGFLRGELEEFYKSLRAKVKFPCLVTEGFKNELEKNPSEMLKKNRTTSFTVVCGYDTFNDYDAIEKALGDSERHGEEFIRKLITDGKEERCFGGINDISTVMIENESEKYIGVRYTFTITSFIPGRPTKELWN